MGHLRSDQCAAQQAYGGGGGGGLMSSGGPNGGGGWQHDLQHLWTTLLGQLPSTTQPLLKAALGVLVLVVVLMAGIISLALFQTRAGYSDWEASSDATYSPLLSSETRDPGSSLAGSSGGIAGASLTAGGGFAEATGSAVAADSAGLGAQYAAGRAGSAADQRGSAGVGGGGFDTATGGAQATGASADDQRGYWSGAQFDRTSRTDDQLPITARPLVTGAADSAGVGVRGTATDDRGVGAMGAAAGMAGGGGGAGSASHDSDVLEELKYRQQMEVYKQTQAAAGLAGAAGAGSGVRGGGADTQPGDGLPQLAGVRDPGAEVSAGSGSALGGRGQGRTEGAGAHDVGGGRSRDQDIRDMRAGMLGVDPGEEDVQAPDLRGRVRPRERGGAGRLGDAESVAAGLVTDGAYLRGGGADRLRGSTVGGLAANGNVDADAASDRGGGIRPDAALSDSARDATAADTGATHDDRGLDRGGLGTGAAGGAYRVDDTSAAQSAIAGGAGSLASQQNGLAADTRAASADRLDPRADADARVGGLTRGGGEGDITAGAHVRGAQTPAEGSSVQGAAGGGLITGLQWQGRSSERGSTDEQGLLPGTGAATGGATVGDVLSTRAGAEVGGAGGAVATQGAQSLAASRAADAGGALGEDAVSRVAGREDVAGDMASVRQHREQQPEGGREISAGGAASYMNPDEGEEDAANPVERQGGRSGAVTGSADDVQRIMADAAAQSTSVGDAGIVSGFADRSTSAGAASHTAADAESALRDAGAQVGAALVRGAGTTAGLVASAVGLDSAEGSAAERLGSALPGRRDEGVASGTGPEVEPATAASQLGADRRELLPTDAVSATGSLQSAGGRDGVAGAAGAGLDDRGAIETDADRRRYGDNTAAQAAGAGSQAARGSVDSTAPVTGAEAAQRNPLLGFDPTADASAGKGPLVGGHGAASALDANMAQDAAAKGSVSHRDGTGAAGSSMLADRTDPGLGAGRGSTEGQLSGLSSTDAAKQSELGADSGTAVGATDSHIGLGNGAAGAGNGANQGGESLSDLAAMGLVTRATRVGTAGKAQRQDEQTSERLQQQPYKGLGSNSVVSADGKPLTRSADAGMATGGAIAPSAAEGAAASGLISSGEGGTASGLRGGQGGLREDIGAGAGLTSTADAGGAGSGAGMAEPAKTVSMDGDIIATASKAEAVTAAAADSPVVGDVGALPEELKRSSASSTVEPDNQGARLASASLSAVSGANSAADRSAGDVVSSSDLLADRGMGDVSAQAAGGSAGARSADPVTGLASGRGSGVDERAASDAIVTGGSGRQSDSFPDAGAAGLDLTDTAARADGISSTARKGDSSRERAPQNTVAAQDSVERAARQSAERAAAVEAARGQVAGAAFDVASSTEAGSSAAGGSVGKYRQDSVVTDAETGIGSIGASGSAQRQHGSDEASAGSGGGAGVWAMLAQGADAVQGAVMSTGQALSGIAADPQGNVIGSRSQEARL